MLRAFLPPYLKTLFGLIRKPYSSLFENAKRDRLGKNSEILDDELDPFFPVLQTFLGDELNEHFPVPQYLMG